MRLDLGAGQRCRDGFIGVDIAPTRDSIKCDLFKTPWLQEVPQGRVSFESDSVDEVNCSHFVEHIPDLIAFINELGRVMKPGAIATIRTPYYTSSRAFQDPTHVRFITDASFVYFDKAWREREGLGHYPITCDFEQVQVKHWIHPDWDKHAKDDALIKSAMRSHWNVVEDIEFTLRKR